MANEASHHHIKEWCSGKLSYFLGFEDAALTDYILTFKSRNDLEEYLSGLLGDTGGDCQTFIYQLCEKLCLSKPITQSKQNEVNLDKKQLQINKREDKKSHPIEPIKLASYKPCNCQAREHPLLTNCLECGRIACIMEGSICPFCQTDLFADDSNADQKKKDAEEQRNKLLHFQNTSAMRTRVIDDQTDFYESRHNQWLTLEEKERRQKKEKRLRELRIKRDKRSSRSMTVTIDIQTKQFIEEEDTALLQEIAELEQELIVSEATKESQQTSETYSPSTMMSTNGLKAVYIPNHKRKEDYKIHDLPIENKSSEKKAATWRIWHDPAAYDINYIMDNNVEYDTESAFQEINLALCIDQPYATLLVSHKLSSWLVPCSILHRGLLWIVASSLTVSEGEIQRIMDKENVNWSDKSLLPCGAIVGHVQIDSCHLIDNQIEAGKEQQFMLTFSRGESLQVPMPLSTNRKGLFSLDPSTLLALKALSSNSAIDETVDPLCRES